jgi:hypothetical protein
MCWIPMRAWELMVGGHVSDGLKQRKEKWFADDDYAPLRTVSDGDGFVCATVTDLSGGNRGWDFQIIASLNF